MLLLSWNDPKSGELVFLRFDVVTNQTHDSIMQITQHPVEEGSDVVDHARPEPKKVTIEGYVSNKPLWSNPGVEKFMEYAPTSLVVPQPPRDRPARRVLDVPKPPIAPNAAGLVTAGVGALLGAVLGGGPPVALLAPQPPPDSPVRATVLQPMADFPNRVRLTYETLLAAQEARALIRIESMTQDIESMMLEKVSSPRTAEDGNGASFSVDLTQVRIVKSATVAAPQPAEARGAKPVDKGSRAAQIAKNDDANKAQYASFAINMSKEALARVGKNLDEVLPPARLGPQ